MAHANNQALDPGRDYTHTESNWPTEAANLPLFLTQKQLSNLFDVSERTLERQRTNGTGVPFTKIGRRVLYPRDAVLNHLADRIYSSASEARKSAQGR
ncbi:hypothetical protein MnTg02_02717 [bacterium MnTg02]|nr:hypothetical protein MnTg02_02717 [bacterium MnTg02]